MKTERNEVAEKGVRRKYNRTVVVEQAHEKDSDGYTTHTVCKITSKFGKLYTLDEYLKGNLTDYVDVAYDSESKRFDKYIDAEQFVMEQIGGEK
jgi:hypothetical protein